MDVPLFGADGPPRGEPASDSALIPAQAPEALVDIAASPLEITQALPTPGREEIALTADKVASGSL